MKKKKLKISLITMYVGGRYLKMAHACEEEVKCLFIM